MIKSSDRPSTAQRSGHTLLAAYRSISFETAAGTRNCRSLRRPLGLGSAARSHLRGSPAALHPMWRRNAHHRLHRRRAFRPRPLALPNCHDKPARQPVTTADRRRLTRASDSATTISIATLRLARLKRLSAIQLRWSKQKSCTTRPGTDLTHRFE